MKIELDGAEIVVGMKLWSVQSGWDTVALIRDNSRFPIVTRSTNTYTADGKFGSHDRHRSLFLNEIDLTPPAPPKKKVKKWLWVMRSNGTNDLWITEEHVSEDVANRWCRANPVQRIDSTMIEVEE